MLAEVVSLLVVLLLLRASRMIFLCIFLSLLLGGPEQGYTSSSLLGLVGGTSVFLPLLAPGNLLPNMPLGLVERTWLAPATRTEKAF